MASLLAGEGLAGARPTAGSQWRAADDGDDPPPPPPRGDDKSSVGGGGDDDDDDDDDLAGFIVRDGAAAAAAAADDDDDDDGDELGVTIASLRQRHGIADPESRLDESARKQRRPRSGAAAAARCAPRCFDAAAAAPRWVGTSTRRRRRAAAPCARLQLVTKHKVVLFMKGTPSQPMCGFSAQTVRLLHQHGA